MNNALNIHTGTSLHTKPPGVWYFDLQVTPSHSATPHRRSPKTELFCEKSGSTTARSQFFFRNITTPGHHHERLILGVLHLVDRPRKPMPRSTQQRRVHRPKTSQSLSVDTCNATRDTTKVTTRVLHPIISDTENNSDIVINNLYDFPG